MSEQRLPQLEGALVEMGAGMSFPATPNFAGAVFGELARTSPGHRSSGVRPRLGALAIVGVALAVGAAAAGAYYISSQTWLSSEPRGVQFSDEFELTRLFEADQSELVSYLDFDSDGEALYAIADPYGDDPAVVRFTGLDGASVQPETLFSYADLADPALWQPGVDLGRGIAPLCCEGRGMLAAAPNGDLFLLASTNEEFIDVAVPGSGRSLIVVRPDGSRQAVASIDRLYAEVAPGVQGNFVSAGAITVAANGQVWLFGLHLKPDGATNHVWSLKDANSDGDWSDVAITRYELPELPPQASQGEDSFTPQARLVPAPSGENDGTFFIHARRAEKGHDLYRASDLTGDGDLLDESEFALVFRGEADAPQNDVQFLPRTAVGEGRELVEEFIVSGLSNESRLSRISNDGEVTDIARAFGHINDVTLASDGNLFVWANDVDRPQTVALYRLRQLEEGETPSPDSLPATEPTQGSTVPEARPDGAVAYVRRSYDPASEAIILAGFSGESAPLISGTHNSAFCQSPTGTALAYASDAEVPGEYYLYLTAGGAEPVKVTERQVGFYCLSERYLLLSEDGALTYSINLGDIFFPGAGRTALTLYDIESGEERPLLDLADRWSPSPDGSRLAFVSIEEQGEVLEVVDVTSGERQVLAGPLADGYQFNNPLWSRDSQSLAYVVGPPQIEEQESIAGDFTLYEQAPGSEARAVHTFADRLLPPRIDWSPSGDWFLVESTEAAPCSAEVEAANPGIRCEELTLLLIDAAGGELEVVARNSGYFSQSRWAPDRDEFVYPLYDPDPNDEVAEETFWISAPGQEPRELLRSSDDGRCPSCDGGFGWSPDGRYIGFFELGGIISVLDVASGELKVIVDEPEDVEIYPRWWIRATP